jgi:hypothetical protein
LFTEKSLLIVEIVGLERRLKTASSEAADKEWACAMRHMEEGRAGMASVNMRSRLDCLLTAGRFVEAKEVFDWLKNAEPHIYDAEFEARLALTYPAIAKVYDLVHIDDPAGKCRWPFVYFHADAEGLVTALCREQGWDSAPDLVSGLDPFPYCDGEYRVSIYGRPGIAALRHQSAGSIAGGRVALLSDPVGLAHARRPENWR